ncbi:hypothetical protein [uncultured Alsobacter sp.]|uniref:hypothetical protein n=1 Tax=uncultured Alsobacter sp. TaxID=1748258 RepID=UPI0025ECD8AA|nr:hypothetical protein [uncultured Alsobacter sp.]
MFGSALQLPHRAARLALVGGVIVSGTLTGVVLAALATRACQWLFQADPIVTAL